MKRTLFAATIAVQVLAFPTMSSAAAVAAAQPVDAKTEALIQQCIDNNLLLPEQVQTMNDAELNAVLVDCAASLQTAAVAPPPVVRPAPVVVEDAPVVVHRRARFVAAAEPEFVGGGDVGEVGGGGIGGGGVSTPININSNNTSNSGNGDGNVFGDGNVSGGVGGGVLGGIFGNGNGNGGGAGGGNGGAGAAKLNNIQKDALIGAKLNAGESKSSSVTTALNGGLKKVTDTKVTKLADGNVRVTQTTKLLTPVGTPIGTPKTKSQSFTPADVDVFKQAHGDAPLDNLPSFAKKGGTFAALKNGETGAAGHSRFAAMRARLAGLKDGKTGVAAGNNRFAAMRERLAAAKDGKTGIAAGNNRFAAMRERLAAAKNGKLGATATNGSAHNRFAQLMKRRQLQTAQGKTGSGISSSIGKMAKKSDRGIFRPSRQAKASTSVKHASKIFARHRASKAAKVAKSLGGKSHGGSLLRRLASR